MCLSVYIYTRIYGRATRALASPLYLLAALRQGQRLSLSHAQFSFGFCTKNLSSGEGGKSACKFWARNKQRLRENPKQPKPPSEYFQKTREAYKMCTNPCEKTPPNKVKRFLRLAEPLGRPSRALRAVCKQIFGEPPMGVFDHYTLSPSFQREIATIILPYVFNNFFRLAQFLKKQNISPLL